MAQTTYVDDVTVIYADWLNEVDKVVHGVFNGATSTAAIVSSLNLVIGTNVQAYNSNLDTFAGIGITTFGSQLIQESTTASARNALSLVIGTDVQEYDATLNSIAGLGTAANKLLYTTGVDTWAETNISAYGRQFVAEATTASGRSALALGSLAILSSVNNGNWSGTDLSVANGGTGQSTQQAAIDALTNVSAASANQVLTKDGSGNATFQDATGAESGYDRPQRYFAEMYGYAGADESCPIWNYVSLTGTNAAIGTDSLYGAYIYAGDGTVEYAVARTTSTTSGFFPSLSPAWATEKRRMKFSFRNPTLDSQYLFCGFGSPSYWVWSESTGHADEHVMVVLNTDDEAYFSTGNGTTGEVTALATWISNGEVDINNEIEIIWDGPAATATCYVNGTLRATHTTYVPSGTAEANYLWETTGYSHTASSDSASYRHMLGYVKVDIECGLS